MKLKVLALTLLFGLLVLHSSSSGFSSGFSLSLGLGFGQQTSGLKELVEHLVRGLDIAIHHAVLGRLAADLQDLKIQAHQVLNVLVGRGGPGYDPSYGDPGDGMGLVTDARRLVREVAGLDQRYQLISDNIRFFVESAVSHVQRSIRTGKASEARAGLYHALAYLLAARGAPQDLPSEGGARTLQRLLGG